MAVTDARARRLQPNDVPLRDGMIPGLYLFPSGQIGRGKWILRFVSPLTGKRRDMGLGSYPDTTIREARTAAAAGRGVLHGGQDPIELRRLESSRSVRDVPTFEIAARMVHADMKPGFRNAKHADQWINTLEDYIFPTLGFLPVDKLTPAHFAAALRPIWLSKPETASRVRQRCDTAMKWSAARGYVVASPLSVVGSLLARQPGKRERVEHHPAIPWREIPTFIRDQLHRPRTIGRLMLELLILTASRSGEVRGMEWQEVDLETATWTVAASRMKAKVLHRVPLTSRSTEILRALKVAPDQVGLVFSTRNCTPLSDMVLTKVLRDANASSDVRGRIATAHGFRSSFRDWASENGYGRDLAERALAHTIRNTTEEAYHRTDLLDQRREMMMAWEKHCLRLVR